MDFSPDLHCRLSSLNAALARNVGSTLRPRWFPRHRRLAQRLRQRQALLRWRALRDGLLAAGMPPLPARLAVVDDSPAFFWAAATGARVLLPADNLFVPGLTSNQPTPYAQAILLLHEWGHALLYPQADHAWLNELSGPAREHAHPAWAQVGEYAGWRVFNEMFADGFAVAWMLRLFNRSTRVIEALRALRDVRKAAAQHFNHIDFPCHHQTADVIDRVMCEQWDGEIGAITPRLIALCSSAFGHWYEFAPIPGKDVCASSRKHLSMLDRDFSGISLSLSVWGRSWRTLAQPSTPQSRRLLAMLRAENPDHFLLGLRAVMGVLDPVSPSFDPVSEPLLVSR